MKTAGIMQQTLAALLPGAIASAWFFGAGVLINVILAAAAALAAEAAMLAIRRRPLAGMSDGSVLLTGVLLGLSLPPLAPFPLVILGAAVAVVLGKHLYGGTGQNLFNPAMTGFAVLIVSFPLAMSFWPDPAAAKPVAGVLSVKLSWAGAAAEYDGMTRATPLDAYRFREGMTNAEFFGTGQQANWQAWLMINLAFLAGGLYLLARRLIPWQTPAAFLGTLAVLALLFYDGGSSASLGSPVFHLFSGATMLAAFFIITDPVTCPGYLNGLVVFGIGVGIITFIIRTSGAYPEGVAFGVLLMNAASPLIDHVHAAREKPA